MSVANSLRVAADAFDRGENVDWKALSQLCISQISRPAFFSMLSIDIKLIILRHLYVHPCTAVFGVAMLLFDSAERKQASEAWTGGTNGWTKLFRSKALLQGKLHKAKRFVYQNMHQLQFLCFAQRCHSVHIFVKPRGVERVCFGYIENINVQASRDKDFGNIGHSFLSIDDMAILWDMIDAPWNVSVHNSGLAKYGAPNAENVISLGISTSSGYKPIHLVHKNPLLFCGIV